ncbi:MAG: hypothetical protein PUD40_03915 [Bacteroidales bacterium]|nr:hypothetical protein [Bacteroidales bacterium]
MSVEDLAIKKMLHSLNAICEFEQQDETMKTLKDAAFNVLLENAGSDYKDWEHALINEY